MGELKLTKMPLQRADRSVVRYPTGIMEDAPEKVGEFYIPIDFVVVEMEVDTQMPIILGRPFLATAGAVIDVKNGRLTLNVGDEKVEFHLQKGRRSAAMISLVVGWTSSLGHFREDVGNFFFKIHFQRSAPTVFGEP